MRNGGLGGPGGAAAAASYVLCLQAAMSLARSPVGHISFLSLSLSLSLSSPKLNLNCLTYWVRPRYGMGCPLALRCCLLSFVAVRRVRPSRPRPWPGRGRRSRKRDTVAGGGKGGRTDGRTTGKCLDSRFSTAHYFYGPSMRRWHRRQPRRRHFPTARGQKTSHKETRRRREGRPLSRHRALAGEGSIRDRVQHWSHSMRQGKVGLSLYPMPLTSVTACYIHKRNALVRPRPSTLAPTAAAVAPQRRFPRCPAGRAEGDEGEVELEWADGLLCREEEGMTALSQAVTSRGGTRRRQRRRPARTAVRRRRRRRRRGEHSKLLRWRRQPHLSATDADGGID